MQGREHDQVVASIWLGGLLASRAMKAKKRKPVLRHCAHCEQLFAVDPRVGKLHRYCSTPACAKASHTMANAKWLEKWKLEHEGKPYFTGSENCTHVRHWRAVTPKYWRRLKRAQRAKRPQFRLIQYRLSAMRLVALQDTIDTFFTLGTDLLARLPGGVGVALQDSMARKLRRARLRGHEILRIIAEESTR